MCGIVGFTGSAKAVEAVLEGLARLEYRGYDSAGVAALGNGRLRVVRCPGKVASLREKVAGEELSAPAAIGHTRWATHGAPTEANAHPHTDCTGEIARLTPGGLSVRDSSGAEVDPSVTVLDWDPERAEKGGYDHFMLKEILEQPWSIRETIRDRIDLAKETTVLDETGLSSEALRAFERVVIVACGTAWHAGLVARNMIERTSQIVALYLFAIHLGRVRGTLSRDEASRRVRDVLGVADGVQAFLASRAEEVRDIALGYVDAKNALFLGRGTGYPLALEGALKLKEISYIHAEGYHAAEMKHGPIALIDREMPVVVLALKGRRYPKIRSNIEEVRARGGRVIAIASEGDDDIGSVAEDVIYLRAESGIMNSVLAAVPLQLFAYHIAAARGLDVDQPRNLAKSVTVE